MGKLKGLNKYSFLTDQKVIKDEANKFSWYFCRRVAEIYSYDYTEFIEDPVWKIIESNEIEKIVKKNFKLKPYINGYLSHLDNVLAILNDASKLEPGEFDERSYFTGFFITKVVDSILDYYKGGMYELASYGSSAGSLKSVKDWIEFQKNYYQSTIDTGGKPKRSDIKDFIKEHLAYEVQGCWNYCYNQLLSSSPPLDENEEHSDNEITGYEELLNKLAEELQSLTRATSLKRIKTENTELDAYLQKVKDDKMGLQSKAPNLELYYFILRAFYDTNPKNKYPSKEFLESVCQEIQITHPEIKMPMSRESVNIDSLEKSIQKVIKEAEPGFSFDRANKVIYNYYIDEDGNRAGVKADFKGNKATEYKVDGSEKPSSVL